MDYDNLAIKLLMCSTAPDLSKGQRMCLLQHACDAVQCSHGSRLIAASLQPRRLRCLKAHSVHGEVNIPLHLHHSARTQTARPGCRTQAQARLRESWKIFVAGVT